MTSLSLLLLIVGVPLAFVAGSLYLERSDMEDEPRFRLYEMRDGEPFCFAEAEDEAGLGMALATIGQENRENGTPCNIVGILDNRRWLTSLWPGREYTPFR